MTATRRLRTALTATALGGLATVLWAAARTRPELPDAPPPLPPEDLPPGRLVRVPGRGELFVREAGDPSSPVTILLLHGWLFPSDLNWYACYPALAEVGRVIALDHQGHGHGPRPLRPFRLTHAADDAAALLRTLDISETVAVGYSMGGPVAQLLAARHPDLVRGLVLCATADTFNDTPRERWQWRGLALLQLILRLLPRHTAERLVQAQAEGRLRIPVTTLITEDTPPEVIELLPWFMAELARGTPEDLVEAGRELSHYDGRELCARLDLPAAAVITTRDRLVPVWRQRAMAGRIAGCETIEVPLDHDAAGGGAEIFVPALRKAVDSVVGRSA